MPVGYPVSKTGVEIKILKQLFDPEEALIATKMNFIPEESKKIYRRLKRNSNLSQNDVVSKLKEMDQKGTIMSIKKNHTTLYANMPLVPGMYEYQLGHLTPELFKDIQQYLRETYFEEEYNLTGIPQLRTIPVEAAITPDLNVATYDQVRKIIRNSKGKIAIMDCICRIGHDITNEPCKRTDLRKTCMTFGLSAKTFYERGQAKYISIDQALELTKEMEKEGLVPQPSNSQDPFVICNCCDCCCEILSNQKKYDEPAKLSASNYYSKINFEECTGCGMCTEFCPMDAIELEDNGIIVNFKRCIGCGLCVSHCPNHAIKLYKKENTVVPPNDTLATFKEMMDKKANLAKLKKGNS
ncbi:MAG: 4Fe-4S dicluster domain-containing protein [Candidatus Lokiarchaeota archaeon]|nr:4Fe-4S dicluster domain-containing protein [Candidatus Lokiarchaeota archaeon]MBD3340470.1 4Fe-4S dicluster domain-containing protein [Candidatus Lokiarchaeota archaeon]